jgi:hypothetical protein
MVGTDGITCNSLTRSLIYTCYYEARATALHQLQLSFNHLPASACTACIDLGTALHQLQLSFNHLPASACTACIDLGASLVVVLTGERTALHQLQLTFNHLHIHFTYTGYYAARVHCLLDQCTQPHHNTFNTHSTHNTHLTLQSLTYSLYLYRLLRRASAPRASALRRTDSTLSSSDQCGK